MTVELRHRAEDDVSEVLDGNGSVVAALSPLSWETAFFGRAMGGLSLDLARLRDLADEDISQTLELVANHADELGYTLVQTHVDVSAMPLVPTFEAQGFRLVDTRVSFLSKVRPRETRRFEPPFGSLERAFHADLADIQRLTLEGFARNPAFVSRYKHRAWFTTQETERWYAAWIENHLEDTESLFALWRVHDRTEGYYFYTRKGEREGIPLYKGMLAAVSEPYRGHRAHLFLQTFLYDQMEADELWIDNTTQLSNIPILQNHITSGKRLESIELTFFR